jgi:hypothetical protein
VNPHRTIFGSLAFAVCAFAGAGEFQPVEAGTTSLRERMVAIKSESDSLRTLLETAKPSKAKRAEISERLAALETEEKQLVGEIESAKGQSRSPYITYAARASETK